jgi:hypothetical protein
MLHFRKHASTLGFMLPHPDDYSRHSGPMIALQISKCFPLHILIESQTIHPLFEDQIAVTVTLLEPSRAVGHARQAIDTSHRT